MWNTTDSARHQKFVTDYRTTLRTNMTTAADYATDVTIGDYGLIGDARGAALVSKSGSVDWLCWPRFDSPSLFAALLDRRVGGHWKISVEGAHEIKREYLGQSNVLCTEFVCAAGRAVLTDFFPVADENYKRTHLLPDHELLRQFHCLEGRVEMTFEFVPRWRYGQQHATFRSAGKLGNSFRTGRGECWLRSDVLLDMSNEGLATRTTVSAGTKLAFSLTYSEEAPAVIPPLGLRVDEAMSRTARWWQEWAHRARYEGPWREAVVRSALALKLMTYAPSGAIIAAPTTSLPEQMGGDLNWDYRYCWLRDASLTMRSFLELGYGVEAEAFLEWLLHATRLTQPELRVLYTVFGQPAPKEHEIGYLSGYSNSRPVRIGNGARSQFQLDVYGEVIDAASQFVYHGGLIDRVTKQVLVGFGTYVCRHWHEADEGIWEPRGGREHHTHSRLLCWTALDRLVSLCEQRAITHAPCDEFRRQRDAIAIDVRERAWDPTLNSYTAVLGTTRMDATLLLLAWYGFEHAESPRMRSTYERVRSRLGAGPLLYRYLRAVPEGAFGICSFWEVEYLALRGDLDVAAELFDRLLRYRNDVGLYSEEIDPRTGEPLGNFPQAFTHIGLINAAVTLQQASTGKQPLHHRQPSTAGKRSA